MAKRVNPRLGWACWDRAVTHLLKLKWGRDLNTLQMFVITLNYTIQVGWRKFETKSIYFVLIETCDVAKRRIRQQEAQRINKCPKIRKSTLVHCVKYLQWVHLTQVLIRGVSQQGVLNCHHLVGGFELGLVEMIETFAEEGFSLGVIFLVD